jgi:glycosyltransferase involved in cell wall biosynthesis
VRLKLTVVTPSLNYGRFVGRAIDSVGMQPGTDYQHIVVDGGSTDETLQVLSKRPGLSVHVQPGLDSHAAMNYALHLAQGDIVGFLNTDDFYEPSGVQAALAYFAEHPETQMLCGTMRVFHENNGAETLVSLFPHTDPANMALELTIGNPGFNSWFFRRSLLLQLQGFRTCFNFAADRDFLLRGYALAPPAVIPELVYHYRVHQASRTMDPRGTNRPAMIMDHITLIRDQMQKTWSGNPAMLSLLAHWDALERFKLVHRAVCFRGVSFWQSVLQTPWPRVPKALALRQRWLRILFSYPHGGSGSRRG